MGSARACSGAQVRAGLPETDGARALEFGRPRRVPDVQVRTRHGPDDLDPRGRVLAVAPDRTDELARSRRAEGRAVRADDRRREARQARPGGHREPVKT